MLRTALLILPGLLAATSAYATTVRFGYEEHLYKISNTAIVSEKGQHLSLGHRVGINNFIAGCWVSDEGYVLLTPDEGYYFELSKSQIEKYQSEGLLPKPLPGYRIPFSDWFFGTSLWIVCGFTLLTSAIFRWKDRGVKPPPTLTDVLKASEEGPPPQA